MVPLSGTAPAVLDLWRPAPSYDRPAGGDRVGQLNPANNYFDCQSRGDAHSFLGHANNWWLKTDDDQGNSAVWINVLYVEGAADFEPITGVPHC